MSNSLSSTRLQTGTCLHPLFEAQVQLTPDAIALIHPVFERASVVVDRLAVLTVEPAGEDPGMAEGLRVLNAEKPPERIIAGKSSRKPTIERNATISITGKSAVSAFTMADPTVKMADALSTNRIACRRAARTSVAERAAADVPIARHYSSASRAVAIVNRGELCAIGDDRAGRVEQARPVARREERAHEEEGGEGERGRASRRGDTDEAKPGCPT